MKGRSQIYEDEQRGEGQGQGQERERLLVEYPGYRTQLRADDYITLQALPFRSRVWRMQHQNELWFQERGTK